MMGDVISLEFYMTSCKDEVLNRMLSLRGGVVITLLVIAVPPFGVLRVNLFIGEVLASPMHNTHISGHNAPFFLRSSYEYVISC